ncbi:prepilin-type N-terminal cleavage/methylation domain-containing protein [Clostridium sp. AM58-1XD]|uniref:type IV pilin protein n=1 Tax=Clostridium sp. AM58-1XD TaxID=2292307 RepID=UPI000E4E88E4|nr:prepilin-type N-terminal cleavage/methylation domain-containing protein [Clostridium sp. AM58-1XD]RGZ00162.1 prepilin-type N-terminal cleavage/methylation domain-containing protein [Clostridium sp. AM58-1XD]
MKKENNKGFSLIELIIAVAILVVLSGLLAPQLIKYVERSREAKDMQALDSVYVAVNTALTNEDAYDAFTTGTGYGDIKDGMPINTILGKTDKFALEVKAVLGKTEVDLISKRAKADSGVIMVQVREVKGGADDVAGLEVGTYAGKKGTANSDFKVGNVSVGGSSDPESSPSDET